MVPLSSRLAAGPWSQQALRCFLLQFGAPGEVWWLAAAVQWKVSRVAKHRPTQHPPRQRLPRFNPHHNHDSLRLCLMYSRSPLAVLLSAPQGVRLVPQHQH